MDIKEFAERTCTTEQFTFMGYNSQRINETIYKFTEAQLNDFVDLILSYKDPVVEETVESIVESKSKKIKGVE